MFSGENGFGVVAQIDNDAVAAEFFYRAAEQFIDPRFVNFDDLRTFRLAYLLDNNLLSGLRGDSTEFNGFDLLF